MIGNSVSENVCPACMADVAVVNLTLMTEDGPGDPLFFFSTSIRRKTLNTEGGLYLKN